MQIAMCSTRRTMLPAHPRGRGESTTLTLALTVTVTVGVTMAILLLFGARIPTWICTNRRCR